MVGVRNVKWLGQITASREEAEGPWQRGIAYKGFSPMVKDGGELRSHCGRILIQVFIVFGIQDLKGIDIDLALEKHELSVFSTTILPILLTYLEGQVFFLIFLKKDVIRPRVVTSRAKEKIPSMQDLPIQSAIVTPKAGSIVELDDIEANVRLFSFPFCIVCVFRCLFFLICVPSI